jgi:ABC-type glycerol-3-phosphate transport system substrate-binding protein
MGEAEVLNYRADLFAAAGLTRPPATWEEFERYAERLNHPERNEYAISLNLEQFFFFTQNTYLVLLRSLRGTAVDADGHLDLSSPEAHEVFRMLKRWWVKGLISPACRNPGGAADDFKSGLTAMYPNWQSRGLWAMRNEELADRIGFAPLPRAREVGSLIAVYGGLILRGSKVKAEAGQFLMEALGGYGQRDVIAAGKMPVTADTYRRGEVPEWMIPVGETLGRGYSAPEPVVIIELSDYLCVAFHNYLAAPSNDPAPFLAQAAQQVRERIYGRAR